MSGVAIRAARPADRDAASALWLALHREQERFDPRYRLAPDAALRWALDFDDWVRADAHRLLLAEAGGEAAGLLVAHLLVPMPIYVPEPFVHVDDLYVRPDRRGRGVGRRLLESVEAWARERGAGRIQAGVLAANGPAVRFWERAGTAPYSVVVTRPLR